jgi:hypothetical protein
MSDRRSGDADHDWDAETPQLQAPAEERAHISSGSIGIARLRQINDNLPKARFARDLDDPTRDVPPETVFHLADDRSMDLVEAALRPGCSFPNSTDPERFALF